MNFCVLTAFVIALLTLVNQPALAKEADAEAAYQALVARAQTAGPNVDWRELRLAYFNRPKAGEIEQSLRGPRKAMIDARRSFAWNELLKLCQQIIAVDYVDGQAHLLATSALAQIASGPSEDSNKEQAITLAIFGSMLVKDGMSAENAIEVFSVNEEYELMFGRQRRVQSQSLVNQNGHVYDVLQTIGKQGQALTFWFQIDRVLAAEAKLFAPKIPSSPAVIH